MKNNTYLFTLLAVTVLLSSCAQYYTKQGDEQYNAFGYKKATKYYEKAVSRKKNTQTLEKLADCYFKINDYKNAEKYFKEAVADEKFSINSKVNYAKTLMSLGKYDEAKVLLNSVLSEQPDNAIAKALLASCGLVPQFVKDSNRYTISNIDFKGFESYFSPVFYKDGLVFVGEGTETARKKVYAGTMRGYEHLYFSKKDAAGKLSEPVLLNGIVNKHYHSASAALGNNGTDIYFSSISSDKIKMSEKYSRTYNMAIHHDTIVDNEWVKAKDFPYNNMDYSTSHPALSADGKTMYFVSDMSGGLGGSDLYVTNLVNGSWSEPKNLGSTVNTVGNETFPVVGPDSKLYFSSNGHKGLGGLDIFVSDNKSGSYSTPMNLNYPLNSKADDFSVLWNPDMKTGYVSSNRNKADRIYNFIVNPYIVNALGTVTSKEAGKPLAGTTIIFKNLTTSAIDSVVTDSDGKYTFELLSDCDYSIEARKAGYFSVVKDGLTSKNVTQNMDITNDFVLQELVIDKPVTFENSKIFYDLDKWIIRADAKLELDKLVKLMIDNPKVIIELSAHTDSRADDKYNQRLSDKRAKAAVEYLVKKGIYAKRLTAKGYGETMLVNKCSNDVSCTDEEHQQNRRTEFKVTENSVPLVAPEKPTKNRKKK